MKQPRKPTLVQKKLIQKDGLNSREWLVTLEDKNYLHLVDRGMGQREIQIIDRKSGELVEKGTKKMP